MASPPAWIQQSPDKRLKSKSPDHDGRVKDQKKLGSTLKTPQMHHRKFLRTLKAFSENTSGAMAVEYGLIATLLSLVVVGGIGLAFDAIEYLFADTNSEINQALN